MSTVKISKIQEQFWVLQNLYRDNTAYNIASLFRLKGNPDINALEFAINQLVLRHEILRVCFKEKGEEVFQVFVNPVQISIKSSITKLDRPLQKNSLPEEVIEEVHKVFDLTEWPLFRIKLFSFPDDTFILSIVFHHIIVDLRSKEIFAEELSELYNSYCGRYSCDLPGNNSYLEYAVWKRNWMKSEEADQMVEKWKEYITTTPDILEIPSDFERPKVNNLEGQRKYFKLEDKMCARISEFSESQALSPFTFLLTTYAILLNRLSGQQKIIIGVPLTNRRKEEFKDTFGCFINIVPVLVQFEDNITGLQLLKQVRQSLLTVHRIQEVPFLQINDLLRNRGSNSILQAGFTFEPQMQLSLSGLEIEPLIIEKKGSQFDMSVTFWKNEDKFNGYLEYSTLLFKDNTAGRFIEIYKRIIDSFLDNFNLETSKLDILPDDDVQLLAKWNDTGHAYSSDICIHQRFEKQVQKTPDAPALEYGNISMSYSEFDQHINKLANYLIDVGTVIEDIVCVCMERSPELLIAIYAIHKAGAAYMPVNPYNPLDRVETIFLDAKPKLVLTKKNSDNNIPKGYTKVYLDDILTSPLTDDDKTPDTGVNPTNLAYLLYTSGTTGKPKGVMIEHHSVLNKLEWMQSQYPLNLKDSILFKTAVTFDASVWELFWWMLNGAKLAILPPGGEKDPKMIIEEIEDKKITTIIFVPSMFAPFIGYVKANQAMNRLTSLKWIIQIGEAVTPQMVKSFNDLLTHDFNPVMINTYGPTEATIAVSWYECPKNEEINKIYIGKPINNTKLLVLNNNNKIQPIGVPGELVISSVNLSRGYLNRPELNAERFVNFKYLTGENIRGYKTGDIAKWCDNGNIDFIGRLDTQVKVRGFRVELGEIESMLLDFPLVKEAVVVLHELSPENKLIVGYVTLNKTPEYVTEDILKFLAAKLPDYMVPSHLIILDRFPHNTSGKIDRKALPSPDFSEHKEYISPVSGYEKELQQIWESLLNVKRIGTNLNFFDAGGNSLLAIRMVSVIKETLNKNIEPIHILEYPNIRALAGYLTELDHKMGGQTDEKPEQNHLNLRRQDFSRFRKRRR